MNTIYAYSTATYLEKNWIKVGETSLTADERIAQQDTTSNPEALQKLREWSVPSNITDKKIHARLEEMGFLKTRIDKDREWFEVSVDDVSRAINDLQYGISRKDDYAPRPEQQDCVEQAVEYFRNGGDEFLVNAKMRFGKTFASYLIAKELGVQNVLVLTYKPTVKDGWHNDLINHVYFDGWSYADRYAEYAQLNGPRVLFASFQDINDLSKEKWQGVVGEKFDLLVIDEMHYGSDTARAQKTMESLNIDKTLFVSGTPLDALVSGRFDEQNTYTWSYSDEQRKRKAEKDAGWKTEVYRWLPPMSIHSFEVSEEAKRNIACYSEEEQFTMTKMFASDDGVSFNDEASVKLFLDQVFGRGVRKTKSPMKTFAADHTLWVMPPNVRSANAMCALLEKMVGKDYLILNVAGNGITNIKKVKDAIARNEKTITVTVGRFNTGTTVPEWDAVMMLNDGRAPETYFQTIFRVQSPDKARRKEECHVFDFNPERLLELVYSYAELTAKKTQTTNSGVREFLEFCPILDHTDNKVRTIDTEEVVSFIAEAGSYIDRFTSGFLFNAGEATNHLDLLAVAGQVTNLKKERLVTANDTERGKNYQANAAEQKKIQKQQKELNRQLVEKAKVITKKIPAYVLFVDPVGNTEQLLGTDPVDFEEHFEVELSLFESMVESGFINRDRLDRYMSGIEHE